MALSDTKLRSLKPKAKPFQIADGGGLFVEVMPGGKVVWRMRYRLDGKQEKVSMGEYPSVTLAEARQLRENYKAMIAKGISPMRNKADAKSTSRNADTVGDFADLWMTEVVKKTNVYPRNTERALKKDILPAIGKKKIADVTVSDVMAIIDRIKARGSDKMALATRNIAKRLFAYAIARQKISFNPAAAIEAKFISVARSREVALSPDEIGKLLRSVYTSNMRRSHKLAIHLLILTMVRKSELIEATWDEIDFDRAEWAIPGVRMKKDKPHIVYLAPQALVMFTELKALSSGSPYVFPSRGSLKQPISKSTLNVAIRALDLDVREFVIHDFRRTASTHLHEAGFESDVIEKALAHEQGGVRGVYNRAQYAEQRSKMLSWWADFIDAQIEEGRKVVLGRFGKAA